jgi:hypothetical protein
MLGMPYFLLAVLGGLVYRGFRAARRKSEAIRGSPDDSGLPNRPTDSVGPPPSPPMPPD